MSQVSVYQAELGLSSGIGPMHTDECQIDPLVFKAFVDALLAWHRRASHAVMAALSEGFVATVLVLAGEGRHRREMAASRLRRGRRPKGCSGPHGPGFL
ncbi:DUF6086 family protein [Streptomyces sp. NBC_01381]|uniref:DUF6086 family protein n=1 Tax=Streptomyces sp. NBC_01381 TaxID=2903845 RepID=UPI002B1D2ED2|nr:DUF6086 family protein [Streptomyces sp. NBC_01381]